MDENELVSILGMHYRVKLTKYKEYITGHIRLFNDKIFITIYDDGKIEVNSKNQSYMGNIDYGDQALRAIKTIKNNILYCSITALLIWTLFTLAISSVLFNFIKR
jgi:hypothetical protein